MVRVHPLVPRYFTFAHECKETSDQPFKLGLAGASPAVGANSNVPRKHRQRCSGFVNRGAGRKSLTRLQGASDV